MNLEEKKKRLGEIQAKLAEFKESENISEHLDEINSLGEEFEQTQKEVSAYESMAKIEAISAKSNRRTQPSTPRVEVVDKYAKTGGFKNFGDLAKATVGLSKGIHDNRFQNATAYEFIGEDGGVLVPQDFLSEIKEKMGGDQSLLPRCRQFSPSGNNLSIPVNEKQPWNGGIKAYWTAEGASMTDSKPELGEANFRLHKLTAMVKATDELLEDASALDSYIRTSAPEAIVHKINNAIIDGSGVGQPKGILNSGFKVEVAKEGAQAADTVVYENIIKMESRLLPNSNAIWIANPAVKEQLRQMKFGTNEIPVYTNGNGFPNIAGAQYESLMGRPIVYMLGGTKALGDAGDLILADLSYYYAAVKGGISADTSMHLYFDRNITAFRFVMRIDGHCPFTSPVSIENGSYDLSGFITLAARA